jgi:uncharacterized membrane protein
VRWTNTSGTWDPLDLGTLPSGTYSYAYALNGAGTVVGSSDDGEKPQPEFFGPPPHAIRWDATNLMVDLNTKVGPGWKLRYAVAIDDSRRIGANGVNQNVRRGCVLVPTR